VGVGRRGDGSVMGLGVAVTVLCWGWATRAGAGAQAITIGCWTGSCAWGAVVWRDCDGLAIRPPRRVIPALRRKG
jgi:hypothetical protein